MHRILKVFCTGVEQDRLAETLLVVARYEGFVIVEIAEKKMADLARRFGKNVTSAGTADGPDEAGRLER